MESDLPLDEKNKKFSRLKRLRKTALNIMLVGSTGVYIRGERQFVRKHVEAAWKKAEKDTKGFIPPIIATLT